VSESTQTATFFHFGYKREKRRFCCTWRKKPRRRCAMAEKAGRCVRLVTLRGVEKDGNGDISEESQDGVLKPQTQMME
jgi:hypothetical protein